MTVNLSIKDVPDQLAASLRQRAARNHRSLQGELMAIVEAAVSEQPGELTSAIRGRGAGKTVEQISAERRLRFPLAVEAGPLAVDIIRADRDGR